MNPVRAAAFAFGLAALLGSGVALAQSDQDKAAARQLGTQGAQALAANKYAEALDLVTRAEAMYHAPTHLAMIARAQIGLGHFVAAREAYLKLAREELPASAPPPFKAAVEEARRELPGLEQKIANLRIVLTGAEGKKVTLKVDEHDVPAALVGVYAPIDPGKHEVQVLAGAPAPLRATVELGPGEKKEVAINIPADAPGEGGGASPAPGQGAPAAGGGDPGPQGFFTPMRIAGVAVGGAGVAGTAVGVIFLASYLSQKSDADKQFAACNPGCSATQIAAVKQADSDVASKGTIAAIALPIGGAALVAGATLVVLGKPAPAVTTGSVRIVPFAGPSGGGFAGSF